MNENMDDKLQNEKKQQLAVNSSISTSRNRSHSLSVESINQLKVIANDYMESKNYGDACNTLQTLIRETYGLDKIPHAIQQINCLMHLDRIQEAKQVGFDIVSLFGSSGDKDEAKRMCREYDAGIKGVAELFIENAVFDIPFVLIECLFKITSLAYSGDTKVVELEMLGRLMHKAALKMNRENAAEELKPQLALMERILDELENTPNVTMTTKCLQVTWMLKYYGACCIVTKEYEKSLSIYGQAIGAMKTVFGENACKYKVFGYCYHNLGLAFAHLKQDEEGNSSFIKAIDIYNSATDWLDENEKENCILKVSANFGTTSP